MNREVASDNAAQAVANQVEPRGNVGEPIGDARRDLGDRAAAT